MLINAEKLQQKTCPGQVPPLQALVPQQDTSLEPLPRLSSLGRCWHQSYATFQLHTQGAVTTCMVQTAGAEVWSEEPRELLVAQPWGPSMASSHRHPPMYQLLGYLSSQKEMLQWVFPPLELT